MENTDNPAGGDKPTSRIQTALDAALGTLDEHSQPDAVRLALEKLAVERWDDVDRALVRDSALRVVKENKLGSAKLVDAVFAPKANADNLDSLPPAMRDVTPWSVPVDGAAVLREMADLLRAHLVLPEGAAEAIPLWALHTHAFAAASFSPSLGALSPVKRCGKTTLLTILTGVVRRPLAVSNMTAATVFRSIAAWEPTLLMDEAETYVVGKEDLRGILNSGHTPTGAFVVRCQGDDFKPTPFSTWCPKFFALIGELPGTLEDRSICIRMRRKMRGEQVKRWNRGKTEGALAMIQSKMARWANDHLQKLREADPATPDELHDRATDNWHPLLAIADAAGGDWPELARAAARTLSEQQENDPQDHGLLLLEDIRMLFRQSRHEDRLPTAILLDRLLRLEERPWSDWKHGRAMTGSDLAIMLRPFGIRSTKIRVNGGPPRQGYYLEPFESVFARYLPPEAEQPEQVEHPELMLYFADGSEPVELDPVLPALIGGESEVDSE